MKDFPLKGKVASRVTICVVLPSGHCKKVLK